ncbi:MAG: hypothetical protein U5M72_06810 [Pseudomonas sp.]|nr:hypothetical protein [Pseudomonas sp.]
MSCLCKSAKQVKVEQLLDSSSCSVATMSNPDLLSDAELRVALDRANADIFRQAMRINDLELIGSSLAKTLAKVCELHLAGGVVELNAEIERLAAHYQHQKTVMSAARKVH